jgi:hypothetical protein
MSEITFKEILAGVNECLCPAWEPEEPVMVITMGDSRNWPPSFVEVNGIPYAVSHTNNVTSYSGGGSGPIPCRLFTIAQLIGKAGRAQEVGTAMLTRQLGHNGLTWHTWGDFVHRTLRKEYTPAQENRIWNSYVSHTVNADLQDSFKALEEWLQANPFKGWGAKRSSREILRDFFGVQ